MRSYQNIILCFSLLLAFTQCDKIEPIELVNSNKALTIYNGCNSSQQLINKILEHYAPNNLIADLNLEEDSLSLFFQDGTILNLCAQLINSINEDPANCKYTLEFTDEVLFDLEVLNCFACNSAQQQIDIIEQVYQTDNILKLIELFGENYVLTFENDSTAFVCTELISNINEDPAIWQTTFEFTDGTTFAINSVGTSNLYFTLNPNGNCPLCGELSVESFLANKIEVVVIGIDGDLSNISKSWDSFSNQHQVPVFGLYADHQNLIQVIFRGENNHIRKTETIYAQTSELNYVLPNINIIERDKAQMQDGLTLVSYLAGYFPTVPFMFDEYGQIRWYIDVQNIPVLSGLFYDCGVERLQNGNLYFGDIASNQYYEMDMMGNLVNSWPIPPGFTFHHNIQEKPDGNFLITVNKNGALHQNGNLTVEDHIIEVDRNTGALVHEWDLRNYLDEWRISLIDNLNQPEIDWVHCNAVIYDESDNSIIVSGRTQGVFKIGYDDELKWILGPHSGWGNNRLGQQTSDYLLEAVDENDNPLNFQVQSGVQNDDNFEWNWYQHAVLLRPDNGNLMLFDNGEFRNFDFSENSNYSRAVEYEIDEVNGTVKQIWQYGKERERECRALYCSDVDYNLETNNVIFAPGIGVQQNGYWAGGRVVELNYDNSEVVFDAVIESGWITFHRVERLPIYPF